MPASKPLRVGDYYDLVPPIALSAGDIWSDLPTFGLIPGGATRAIVITPACDLSNRKVATVSYLPIVPLRRYFLSPSFVPVIRRETDKQLAAARLPSLPVPSNVFAPPDLQQIDAVRANCTSQSGGLPKGQREARTRAAASLVLLRACHHLSESIFPETEFVTAFGAKNWKATVQKVIQNSHRLDTFFLPSDGQSVALSAVPDPSVVLFRYPFSAPIQLLECAQDVQLVNWDTVLGELRPLLPGIDAFATRPLKRGMLRAGFLGDLLTRFVAMHVRLGAPDLPEGTVQDIVNDLTGVIE